VRLKWKLDLFGFDIVLILMQDKCPFLPNIPQAQKIFWTHPMDVLGNVGHVESRFCPFRDSASFGARFVPNIPKGQKSFWTHPFSLRGNAAQVEAQFSPFRECGNLDARLVHGLHRKYHGIRNCFGRTRRNS
jgi:hypothetical protein